LHAELSVEPSNISAQTFPQVCRATQCHNFQVVYLTNHIYIRTMTQMISKVDAQQSLLQPEPYRAFASVLPEEGIIRRRPVAGPEPLSYSQERIWIHSQLAGVPLYNESITIHKTGSLDLQALERSLSEILRRHEAWRTTFNKIDGCAVQIVNPASAVTLLTSDIREFPADEREAEALRLATVETRQPFDLVEGPLLRFNLIRLNDDVHRLYITAHQVIVDGVSVHHVFFPELVSLYKAFSTGKRSPLPELPIQYSDFVYWHRQWLRGGKLADQLAYWSQQLTGNLPSLELHTDRTRPASQTLRGAIQPFVLTRDLSEAARIASNRGGVTLFITLLTAFYTLLHRYTGQRTIVVGTVAPAGRKHSEVQQLLGYFQNPVALLIDLSDNPTFYELQQRARDVTVGALGNDDVPFELLVENLRLLRDPKRHPAFQVAISLKPSLPILDPEWNVTTMDVASGGARWDFYLEFDNRPDGILGRVQYNPDLFDAGTISQLLEDFRFLLGDLAANPLRRVAG